MVARDMNRTGMSLLWAVGTLSQLSCASDNAASKPTSTASDVAIPDKLTRIADDAFQPGAYTRRDLDLNRDNTPDAYQFIKVVDGQTVVIRKEVDVNFDSKVDLIRNLDDKGELVSERLDTDFDARIDLVVFFEKGAVVRKEYDTNFDQRVDMWRFFEAGVIARREADLDYNGKVDYWEYYEAGNIDRAGTDTDGDGEVDQWDTKEAG
jgi:hypothetical protein